LSGPQIWNIEEEKDREKEEVGGRPAKLNEKKGDWDLEREIKKNKGYIFFVEEQHENIVAAVTKGEMLAATNAGENERQWKKVNETRTTFPPKKRVTKKFLDVSRCSRAKQHQRNVQKKSVLHVQSRFFANQTYCCFSPFSGVAFAA